MAKISQEVNIEMLEKLEDGTYMKLNPATKADLVEETAEKQFVSAQQKEEWGNVNEDYLNELVKTPVPEGAVFTDTTYKAGNNITIDGNVINATTGDGSTGVSLIRVEIVGDAKFSFAHGGEAPIKYSFASGLSTNATANYYVDGLLRTTEDIEHGSVEFDLGPYLKAGNNAVEVVVTDVYGGRASITYLITGVTLRITSIFDEDRAYTGNVDFRFTPYGALRKTIYLKIDGVVKYSLPINSSGQQVTQMIPNLSHGGHTIEAYAEAIISGRKITSNTLKYTFVVLEEGNMDTIIATDFKENRKTQGELINIPYKVYTPNKSETDVSLYINDEKVSELRTDRKRQYWNISTYPIGLVKFRIEANGTEKEFLVNVLRSEVNVEASTADLDLYLTSAGRTNSDADRDQWVSGDYSADLINFNYSNNGWIINEKQDTVLRVSGDARLYIPYEMFAKDSKQFGSTIDIEFMIKNVSDYKDSIVSCKSGNIGFEINGQEGILSTRLMNDEVSKAMSVNFKEDEKIRLSFVMEPRSANRLIYIYLNGIVSGVYQYDDNDSFTQTTPVGLTIGSNFADIDVYSIRKYDSALIARDILNNYIADTRNLADKTALFMRNNIFDDYSNIDYNSLLSQLPSLTIIGEMPIAKGNEREVSLIYKNSFDPTRDFYYQFIPGETDRPIIDVQGTSSQYYPRKNYKMTFPEWYRLRPESIPEDAYTFKADYMDSSHALNTGLAKVVHEVMSKIAPLPPQKEDPTIRHAIDGFPVTIFQQDDENAERICLGAYNFNNDEKNASTFGYIFEGPAEQWEGQDNSGDRTNFRNWETSDRKLTDDWDGRFEKHTDTTAIDRLGGWISSTEGNIQKFVDEHAAYIDLDSFIAYYVIVEFFGMVDQLAKNLFVATWDGKLWYTTFYDLDTGIGLNNEGVLDFSYNIEVGDVIGTKRVWNGDQSVLWTNITEGFPEKVEEMYNRLRKMGLTYENTIERLVNEQISVIPEALYNYDSQYKYIDPLINDGIGTYLYIAQGSREDHIKWWMKNRIEYLDSKYKAEAYQNDFIAMRLYSPQGDLAVPLQPDFELVLSDDQYITVRYGSIVVSQRAVANEKYIINAPSSGGFNDTETVIYGAKALSDIGDLAGKYVGTVDISSAEKLRSLKVGSGVEGYQNTNLTDVTTGNNRLLRDVDVRNCPNLNKSLDLSGCNNIEEVYATGTSIPSVSLPVGGIIKTLHLPETMVALNIQGHQAITDFRIDGYENISSVRVENSKGIDLEEIILNAPKLERIRLYNADLNFTDEKPLVELTKLAGLDENDNDIPQAVMTGKARLTNGNQQDLRKLQLAFPELEITVDNMMSDFTVTFVDWDNQTLDVQDLLYGQYPVDPTTRLVDSIDIPTRAPHELFNYFFSGWESFDTVQQTIVIKAKYVTDYVVAKFLNWDGSLYHTQVVKYGEAPYDPVAGGDVLAPTKPATDRFAYTFSNWIGDFSPTTDHVEFMADFTSINIYEVVFRDWDAAILKSQSVLHGRNATAPANPTREKDALSRYEFNKWSKDFTNVQMDLDIEAIYTKIDFFTVIFKDWDGAVVSTQTIDRGDAAIDPRELGYVPHKPGDSTNPNYFFESWGGNITNIQANTTFTAVFSIKTPFTLMVEGQVGTVLMISKGENFTDKINALTSEDLNVPAGRVVTGWSKAEDFSVRNPVITNFTEGMREKTLYAYTEAMPEGYVLATDADFRYKEESSGYKPNTDGYIGGAKKIVLPMVIHGKDVKEFVDIFKDTMVEGVSYTPGRNGSFSESINSFFREALSPTLDLSGFNTSSVTTMSNMFAGSAATELDLSSFDTSKVTSMNSMFSNSSATKIDLSSFDTSKVTNMSYMFRDSAATELDLSNFDTSKVTDMSYMFRDSAATELDLSNFDTSKVTNMSNMFAGSAATTLDLSSFDTSRVTSMSSMFSDSKATELDLSSFDTSKVTRMNFMFYKSAATTGYARTQEDADKFNSSSDKPSGLTFVVKP